MVYGVFAASIRTHLIDRPGIVDSLRRLVAASFVALDLKLPTPAIDTIDQR